VRSITSTRFSTAANIKGVFILPEAGALSFCWFFVVLGGVKWGGEK
jgi:hypothetical protein